MVNKQQTLKIIKEKVDSRINRIIKLKKKFMCEFSEGIFRHKVRRRVESVIKQGNSVMWMDETRCVRNINELETQDLHKIMWQLLNEKEKREIAYEHLLSTKKYLDF